jgi:hypothetical protein
VDLSELVPARLRQQLARTRFDLLGRDPAACSSRSRSSQSRACAETWRLFLLCRADASRPVKLHRVREALRRPVAFASIQVVRRVRSAGSNSTTKGLVIRPRVPATSVVRATYRPWLKE